MSSACSPTTDGTSRELAGAIKPFKHQTKPGLVTVAGQGGDELAAGTLNSIFKQAGLKP